MANARGKAIDNTHLSIDQAYTRGFRHRDYSSHVFRWAHVAKFLHQQSRYKTASILDVGCGRDLPLARMLHTDRIAPAHYVGVDYNKQDKLNVYNHNFGDHDIFHFYGGMAFPDGVELKKTKLKSQLLVKGSSHPLPNVITCFEVLEHVEPAHARAMVTAMAQIAAANEAGCDLFISTPNWDPKTGAAGNHVNEMRYDAVGYLLESCGLRAIRSYGTFISQKDYKLIDLYQNMTEGEEGMLGQLWENLSEYYDSTVMSLIFAPLFPAQARNALWHCQVRGSEPKQFPLKDVEQPWTSSEKWKELKA